MKLGSHVKLHNSETSAKLLEADIVQVCFGSPRSWHSTVEPRKPHHTLMIHAPYLINYSGSQRVWKLSTETMLEQAVAAEKYNVKGLVIHGGSYKEHKDREKALHQWESGLGMYSLGNPDWPPIFVENAASGKYSLTRTPEDIYELWGFIHDTNVQFCLDTAHLWASIKKPEDAALFIKEVKKSVGKIPMVHANGSGVPIGSNTDRHSPLATSLAPPDWVAWCIRLCQPKYVITETVAPAEDLTLIRKLLA